MGTPRYVGFHAKCVFNTLSEYVDEEWGDASVQQPDINLDDDAYKQVESDLASMFAAAGARLLGDAEDPFSENESNVQAIGAAMIETALLLNKSEKRALLTKAMLLRKLPIKTKEDDPSLEDVRAALKAAEKSLAAKDDDRAARLRNVCLAYLLEHADPQYEPALLAFATAIESGEDFSVAATIEAYQNAMKPVEPVFAESGRKDALIPLAVPAIDIAKLPNTGKAWDATSVSAKGTAPYPTSSGQARINLLSRFGFPNDGLQHYYSFDDSWGDSVGDRNWRTYNSPSFENGLIGKCASFNTSRSGQFCTAAAPNVSADLTFSIWVKPSGKQPAHAGVFFQQDHLKQSASGWQMYDLNISSSMDGKGHPQPSLPDGRWSHLVITYDSRTETFCSYVNGTLHNQSMNHRRGRYARQSLRMGMQKSSSRSFKGQIDEVGIWNRALSAAEIARLYNGGRGITYVK